MDDHRFDEITRSLTSGASRRGILKRLGALAGGAALGVAAVQSQASAAPPQCRGNQTACSATACCPHRTTCCPVRQGNRLLGYACCTQTQVCRRSGQGGCVAA